jgi:hypothetical protein
VPRPLDDERYDLILDLRPRLLRVQCKWASASGDVLTVGLYSCRRGREELIRRTYSADEIDAFVAYSAETDRCYLRDNPSSPDERRCFFVSQRRRTTRRWASAGLATTNWRLQLDA